MYSSKGGCDTPCCAGSLLWLDITCAETALRLSDKLANCACTAAATADDELLWLLRVLEMLLLLFEEAATVVTVAAAAAAPPTPATASYPVLLQLPAEVVVLPLL